MAKEKIKVRGYLDADYNSADYGFSDDEPSMTQQEFLYESDINNLVDSNMRYKDVAFVTKMQLAGKLSKEQPIFGDFTNVKDYQTAFNLVNDAQDMFNSLPAQTRRYFNDDPSQLVAFVDNKEQNYELGVKLGIYENKNNPNILEKEQNPQVAGSNAGVEPISDSFSETSAPLT